jgi:hypothetical protein
VSLNFSSKTLGSSKLGKGRFLDVIHEIHYRSSSIVSSLNNKWHLMRDADEIFQILFSQKKCLLGFGLGNDVQVLIRLTTLLTNSSHCELICTDTQYSTCKAVSREQASSSMFVADFFEGVSFGSRQAERREGDHLRHSKT